jgi:hypothetical protein
MFGFLSKKEPKNKAQKDVLTVAKQQLKEKRAIIESLRDYDTGKKTISTTDIAKRVRDIQTAV